ncbi:hypothetical protein GM50_7980 [freshwater metagenome]|uniref:Uncharacterized protein n=1 Tax=freshwater metagenome TaxID=449393 RepID=A0A094SJQ9_9ZZZZ
MRFKRPLLIIAAVIATLTFGNLTSVPVTQSDVSENYPPVVCPATPAGESSAISVPSTQTGSRVLGKKSVIFKPTRTLRLMQSSSPTILETKNMTSPVWQIKKGVWAGATICSAPSISQWFVGGTADVTSKGKLILINSGLSEAIIDVEIWSESGIRPPKVFTLKANSSLVQSLDSLDPGAKRIALHIAPRSGRVNAFLVDERGRGLKSLGGDMVNASPDPSKVVVIPAIPHMKRSGKALGHTLRVIAPGDVDARISVELISNKGSFVPFGFDERAIKAGIVTEIPLNPELIPSTFALKITSNRPIVASVYSSTYADAKSDFVWSTSTAEMKEYSLAVSGLAPTLVFAGEKILISLSILYTNKKEKKMTITGEGIATFKVPENARTINFTKVSDETVGGSLVSTQSGFGYLPLIPGSELTRVLLPSANIRVLNP